MWKRFKKLWKGLAFRLLWTVCWSFLPLNIMAVLVSGIVIWNSSEQTVNFYQRDLNAAMMRFEMDLQKIDEQVDSFVMEYLSELTLTGGSDNMTSFQMANTLQEIFKQAGMNGVLYLYDKQEERFFVKYSSSVYSILEIEEMKKQMRQMSAPEGMKTGWSISKLLDHYFYRKGYEFTNYWMGILVDINDRLRTDIILEEEDSRNVYFSDGDRTIRLEAASDALEESESWEDLFQDRLLQHTVLWDSENYGYSVGIQVSRGSALESVPILYWLLMVAALLCVLLILGLWKILQKRVVAPLGILKSSMEELQHENLLYRIEEKDPEETEDFRYIYETFNQMAEEIKLSHEKDIQMIQARLDNLRLQVNPHMLLNSFNMIYSLAQVKNYECIQEFSLYLVEYFRYVLKETDTFVPLKKEMAFVESYINIQKIRFPGAFTSVHTIQPECEDAMVPPLLIENFVENAMKYALIPGQVIEVLINIREEEGRLLISVCDTGRGIREEILESIQRDEAYVDRMGQKHIGIWNCRRRMEVFYDESATMSITSKVGEGTQIWLNLPYLQEMPAAAGGAN